MGILTDARKKLESLSNTVKSGVVSGINNASNSAQANVIKPYNKAMDTVSTKVLQPFIGNSYAKMIGPTLEAGAVSFMSPQKKVAYKPVYLSKSTKPLGAEANKWYSPITTNLGSLKTLGQGALNSELQTKGIASPGMLATMLGLNTLTAGGLAAATGEKNPIKKGLENTLANSGRLTQTAGLVSMTNPATGKVLDKVGFTGGAKLLGMGVGNMGESAILSALNDERYSPLSVQGAVDLLSPAFFDAGAQVFGKVLGKSYKSLTKSEVREVDTIISKINRVREANGQYRKLNYNDFQKYAKSQKGSLSIKGFMPEKSVKLPGDLEMPNDKNLADFVKGTPQEVLDNIPNSLNKGNGVSASIETGTQKAVQVQPTQMPKQGIVSPKELGIPVSPSSAQSVTKKGQVQSSRTLDESIPPEPKLLPGGTEPLSIKQAKSLYKKTGTAYPFENQVKGRELLIPQYIPEGQKALPAPVQQAVSSVQAKATFKQSGKVLPIENKIKPNEGVIPVAPGGNTGTKLYQEGKPQTEGQFNSEIAAWEKNINKETQIFSAYKGGKTEISKEFPAKELSSKGVKDKSPLFYQTETLFRNIEDTFRKIPEAGKKIKQYFYEPVVQNETKKVEFVGNLRKEITKDFKSVGITRRGSAEDMAAADYIEGKVTLNQLQQGFPKKWQGIVAASEKGRVIYKDLLKRINEAITPYGYSPIPEMQDYVTHTRQIATLTDRFGSLLNFTKEKLPTEMSAINMDTKPGRQFFRFGLKRQGGSTHEGLATALDKYMDSAANQIFHTSDIQRGRALEDYITKSAGPQDTKLSNFNSYIRQYTDMLAGKKHVMDRPFEKVFGRGVLDLGSWAKRRTGANMVGANVSSALTNFIPFTESLATTSKPAAVKGLYEGLKSPFNEVNMIDGVKSGYLTRNFPEGQLLPNRGEQIVKGSGALFTLVDKFTKKSVIAGKYFEGLSKGLNPQEAMKAADEYGTRVLVDRSFGQTPLIFNSKTLGMFTQFQTEVNNQVSFVLKDIPKNMGYNKVQVASAITQFAIYSYLFNSLYEKVTGRRPQIDPIHAVQSYVQGLQEGRDPLAMLNPTDTNSPVGELVSNLPFNPSGGRLPIGAAIPDPIAIASGKSTVKKELMKPLFFLAPPAGGGQIKKTIEGLSAYSQGASITPKGNVRYEIPQTPANLTRTAVFGQYSTPEARKYFEDMGVAKSDKIYKWLKTLTPEQAVDQAKQIKKANPSLYSQLVKMKKFESMGITKEEQDFANLGVADTSRSRAIAKKINGLKSAQDKVNYIKKLKDAGIITDDVYKQLVQMKQSGKI